MTDTNEIKNFSVHYGAAAGSNLDKHKMNAYNLGMSIVEFAKMINRADEIINQQSTLELEVTAPAKQGSLVIEFILSIKSIGALEVVKYLGISAASASVLHGSALGIARKLKDKRIVSINTETGSNEATIVLDEEQIVADKTVARLVSDPVIRQAMNEIITQPLNNESSPSFKIEYEGEETFSAENEAIQEFTPLPKASLSNESKRDIVTNVIITQVNFDSNRGWKMMYEGQEVSVKMEDVSFMARVNDSEKTFAKGDMLEVALSIITKITARSAKTKTEYAVTRVIRHRRSSEERII
ncbi:hypothetical protein [Xenorhabdus bovienii]|uniref:hypothetical protein n=1 Tax=Xenorhabdus bovienii TaxID=40576 RepID=UPI003DA2012A